MFNCPLCQHSAEAFLLRSAVPVHQNLLLSTATEATSIQRGRLDLHVCPDCGFVFNAGFDPTRLSYGANYNNSQNHSPAFALHVDRLIADLVGPGEVQNCRVVEVGCGDGAFLRRLVGPAEYRNTGYGFDPSYNGPSSELDGRLSFHQSMYDERAADISADVVICRHVIEHVPQPLELLRSVRRAVTKSTARVFFETPCVDWILSRQVIWDLFYEHCSLFTLSSLSFAFAMAGFKVVNARHVFEGQYLWIEAKPITEGERSPTLPTQAAQTRELAAAFAVAERTWQQHWTDVIGQLTTDGAVAVWGAGAKGVTFCNLLDPDATRLACVVDVNPSKQGRFVAGTGHPILGPDQLAKAEVRHALVLNPNYSQEIRNDLATRNVAVNVHDLMTTATLPTSHPNS